MPFIEDVADLAEALADAVGQWGACPDGEQPSCMHEDYCRVCWVMEIKERMRAAVAYEQQAEGKKEARA